MVPFWFQIGSILVPLSKSAIIEAQSTPFKVEVYCKIKSETGIPVHLEIRLITPTRALLTFCSMRIYVDVDVPMLFAISFWVMPAYFRACSMVNIRRFSISFTSFCVNYNSTKVECQAKSSESRNFYCIFDTLVVFTALTLFTGRTALPASGGCMVGTHSCRRSSFPACAAGSQSAARSLTASGRCAAQSRAR